MKPRGRAAVWGVLCLAGALGFRLWAAAPPLSANDLHLLWQVSPGRFFTPVSGAGGSLLITNPELTALDNGRTLFSRKKPRGVYRIFCVGGSTTRGWPFHERFSYPALLSWRLKDALPGRRVEVINAGFMASSSDNDLALVRELMSYEPDLLLIYEGRNERDALPFHAGPRARLLRAHGWLLRRGLYRSIRRAFVRDDAFDQAKAASSWAARGLTGADEPALRDRLLANLAAMLSAARSRGCALVLVTQAWEPGEDSIENLNAAVRLFAAERSVPLIDVAKAFERPGSRPLFLSRASHPDLPGYLLMADTIAGGLGGEWRIGKQRPDLDVLNRLKVTPEFLAGVYLRLSRWYGKIGHPRLAEAYARRAADVKARGPAGLLRPL